MLQNLGLKTFLCCPVIMPKIKINALLLHG